MKQPKDQRINSTKPIALLLLMLLFTLPLTAQAAMYDYTYTGGLFQNYPPPQNIVGTTWTTSDNISVSFTLDPTAYENNNPPFGGIYDPSVTTTPYTMSAGSVSITVPLGTPNLGSPGSPDFIYLNLTSSTFFPPAGEVWAWELVAYSYDSATNTSYWMQSISSTASDLAREWTGTLSQLPPINPTYIAWASGPIGTWTMTPTSTPSAVPEPTTMFLLGSGLIALAGYGRKKVFKK